MSNSLSAVNSNVAKSGKADYNVEEVQKLHIKALNKLLTSEDENDDDSNLYEEMKDTWYTKEEIKQQKFTQELQNNLDLINKLGSSNLAGRKFSVAENTKDISKENMKENQSINVNIEHHASQQIFKPKYQVKVKVEEQSEDDQKDV